MEEDQWIGVIGPLTHDSCVFQDQRRLVCVDSLTGDELWWRSDVPLGSDLYGDGQYLFVVPRNSKQALVFSTIDGRALGESTVPLWREQLATIGRQVIRWRKRADARCELSSVDALTSEVLWERDFDKQACVDIAEGRYVGVVEPSGRCTITDAANGELLVDDRTEAELTLNSVHLLAGSDTFLLVANQPTKMARERRIFQINPQDYEVLDGYLFLFDRSTGQPVWSRPAEVRQESFALAQPIDLPVVAFAGTIQRRNSRGGRRDISLLLLEKSSGRQLFHDDTLPQSPNFFELKAVDSVANELIVEMTSRTIRLKFTDEPRSPEPPAIVGVETTDKKESSGLYRIYKKLLGEE